MSHPTLAAALPKLAAQIDTERPLIARAIADHVTIEINTVRDEITLHISDTSSYELLTTPSQINYLRQAFDQHGFNTYSLNTANPQPDNPVPPVNDVTPTEPPQKRLMLTLPQRAQLMAWLESHRDRAATDPDSALATSAAAALAFPLNASHVRSVRLTLKIEKTKPELLPEINLAELQKRIESLEDTPRNEIGVFRLNQALIHKTLDTLALEAARTRSVIQQLKTKIRAGTIEHLRRISLEK